MAYVTTAWAYRDVVTSTKLQQMSDNDTYLKLIADSLTTAWTSSTPVLTVDSGTNPTGWSGTGRYVRVGGAAAGKICLYLFQVTAGAGATAGVGNYRISLPVTAVANGQTSGMARLFNGSSGAAYLDGRVSIASSTQLGLQCTTTYGGALGNVGGSVPFAWPVNSIIDGFVIFEAA